ncbi:hypothetical protein [Vibrio scophthalmi]|uniref:Uncharacterized protein n=1 Tax=Vibrio scophthalmi TaxID=45658 RepID=A0A1E3WK33_9VIBR|nr:hypothetical protein [Vibrio scophthalmi]ODS10085.1 hypothetical protein VSF3289_00323 [Vibrio scophthalmi]
MKHQTIESANRDLDALALADQLEEHLLGEFLRIKNTNPVKLLSEAGKMLATGNFDMGKLGLSAQTLEQFEVYLKLSQISRQKHRSYVESEREALLKMGQVEVAEHE